MATLSFVVKKKTFNADKNYFDLENVIIHREESAEELRLYTSMVHYNNLAIYLAIIFSLTGIFGALISSTFLASLISKIFGNIAALFFVLLGFSSIPVFIFIHNKSNKYSDALEKYKADNDVWNNCPEMVALTAYNDEQEKLAVEWRAAHPLEEYIRVCIKDPNSSAEIAALVRYLMMICLAK